MRDTTDYRCHTVQHSAAFHGSIRTWELHLWVLSSHCLLLCVAVSDKLQWMRHVIMRCEWRTHIHPGQSQAATTATPKSHILLSMATTPHKPGVTQCECLGDSRPKLTRTVWLWCWSTSGWKQFWEKWLTANVSAVHGNPSNMITCLQHRQAWLHSIFDVCIC